MKTLNAIKDAILKKANSKRMAQRENTKRDNIPGANKNIHFQSNFPSYNTIAPLAKGIQANHG